MYTFRGPCNYLRKMQPFAYPVFYFFFIFLVYRLKKKKETIYHAIIQRVMTNHDMFYFKKNPWILHFLLEQESWIHVMLFNKVRGRTLLNKVEFTSLLCERQKERWCCVLVRNQKRYWLTLMEAFLLRFQESGVPFTQLQITRTRLWKGARWGITIVGLNASMTVNLSPLHFISSKHNLP